jgi:hypothetical protein
MRQLNGSARFTRSTLTLLGATMRCWVSLVFLLIMSPSAMSGVTTPIREQFFSIQLPGVWTQSTKDERTGLFVYKCQESDEHLTVSIFLARPTLKAAELEEKFAGFVRIRRDAEKKGDPSIVLMDTQISRPAGSITGFHQGRSPSGRLTGNFAIINSAGIANFYYEASSLPAKEFASRVQSILSEITFVE